MRGFVRNKMTENSSGWASPYFANLYGIVISVEMPHRFHCSVFYTSGYYVVPNRKLRSLNAFFFNISLSSLHCLKPVGIRDISIAGVLGVTPING